jgi:hypothetical protein
MGAGIWGGAQTSPGEDVPAGAGGGAAGMRRPRVVFAGGWGTRRCCPQRAQETLVPTCSCPASKTERHRGQPKRIIGRTLWREAPARHAGESDAQPRQTGRTGLQGRPSRCASFSAVASDRAREIGSEPDWSGACPRVRGRGGGAGGLQERPPAPLVVGSLGNEKGTGAPAAPTRSPPPTCGLNRGRAEPRQPPWCRAWMPVASCRALARARTPLQAVVVPSSALRAS